MRHSVNGMMIVTDMDGTMLTTDKQISKENLEAITRFRQNGGRFTVATGRSIPSLEHYVPLLHLDMPVILYNGGTIYDFNRREILWHSLLKEKTRDYVRDVYERFPDIGIEILLDNQIYVARKNEIVRQHLDTEPLEHIMTTVDDAPKGWFKVLFALEPSQMDEFEAYMLSQNYDGVCFVRSFTHYFEMLPIGCTKGGALYRLSELTGVPVDKIVAIGDYYNDLEMVQNAGFGVTVANAPDELKQVADLVVCDNDRHAIANLVDILLESGQF